MQVLIRAKNFSITQGLQKFADQHAKKLQKPYRRIIRVEAFLDQTRSTAEATIKAVIPGKDIVVNRKAKDMYTALSDALERAHRALRKNGEKQKKY